MKRAVVIVFMVLLSGVAFSKNMQYNQMFANLTVSSSNILISALDSQDSDIVYAALKRIGEIRLTNAREKVRSIVAASNPTANVGKPSQLAKMRDLFIIGTWTLGRIGNNQDAATLASYLRGMRDKEMRYSIILALGELKDSDKGLEALHALTKTVKDERLARAVVHSIEKHNKKDSIIYLLKMDSRRIFSRKFRDYLNTVITKLSRSGKSSDKKKK